jgi:CheY-like chemotaxis protein
VEENQDALDLTLRAFRRENLANRIIVVRDGEEALDFVFCRGAFALRSFDHPPKLVMLDLRLPKVDGIEVLRQIKGDARTKTIRVVVMTSSTEEGALNRRMTPMQSADLLCGHVAVKRNSYLEFERWLRSYKSQVGVNQQSGEPS